MPKNTTFVYKKFQSCWFAPIVGFFDLESIIEPVSGCRNNPTNSETRTIEIHKPCSYAMLFVAQKQTEPFHFDCLTGPKVMEQFVQSLETIAKRVYSVKQQHKYSLTSLPLRKKMPPIVGYVKNHWNTVSIT